ncbi:MAG: MATE family efflux transporter [Granulosicoccus sp.]|nr:MATE family efflux transporter [Granulosicoccus sp.]
MSVAPSDITHRTVWMLAGPIILSNISVPLVGAVDTAVVGHLPGPAAIGAVAVGALIFSFLYWGFSFLRMGTTGFIARAYGADDLSEQSRIIYRVFILALLCGGILAVLGRPVIYFALELIESSETVERLAAEYALIRIWSAPATLCVYVVTGILIGLQNTRSVFLLQLVLNITNVVLDIWFVTFLEFGVSGVAWATLIAEYLAALVGLWILRKPLILAIQNVALSEALSLKPMLELMQSNTHILVRTLCLVFSFAFFTAQGAKLGEIILAANAILLHLQSIMAYGLDGFAHAAEALTGSAYGAKNRNRFRQAVKITTLWAGLTAVLTGLIYMLFGEQILGLFSNQSMVLSAAITFLPWMIVSPLISVWSFQLDGVFIGTGHTRAMQNAMLISTGGFLLLVWLLLPTLGNHGLFLALSLFMCLRALTLWVYYPGILHHIPENSPGNT